MEIEVRHNMLHKSLLLQRQVLSAIAYDWMNAHHSFFTSMVHDSLKGFFFLSIQKLFKKSDNETFSSSWLLECPVANAHVYCLLSVSTLWTPGMSLILSNTTHPPAKLSSLSWDDVTSKVTASSRGLVISQNDQGRFSNRTLPKWCHFLWKLEKMRHILILKKSNAIVEIIFIQISKTTICVLLLKILEIRILRDWHFFNFSSLRQEENKFLLLCLLST